MSEPIQLTEESPSTRRLLPVHVQMRRNAILKMAIEKGSTTEHEKNEKVMKAVNTVCEELFQEALHDDRAQFQWSARYFHYRVDMWLWRSLGKF